MIFFPLNSAYEHTPSNLVLKPSKLEKLLLIDYINVLKGVTKFKKVIFLV